MQRETLFSFFRRHGSFSITKRQQLAEISAEIRRISYFFRLEQVTLEPNLIVMILLMSLLQQLSGSRIELGDITVC